MLEDLDKKQVESLERIIQLYGLSGLLTALKEICEKNASKNLVTSSNRTAWRLRAMALIASINQIDELEE